MIIAITGVPGTGKSTLARGISRQMGWGLVCANELVKKRRLWSRKENGVLVADMKKLFNALALETKGKNDLVLEGHLLCEMKVPGVDAVVVLRTEPGVLRKRLQKRKYSKAKTDENVLAEALDYCAIEAERRYEKVYELDTTKSASRSMAELKLILAGKGKGFLAGKISWGKGLELEAAVD